MHARTYAKDGFARLWNVRSRSTDVVVVAGLNLNNLIRLWLTPLRHCIYEQIVLGCESLRCISVLGLCPCLFALPPNRLCVQVSLSLPLPPPKLNSNTTLLCNSEQTHLEAAVHDDECRCGSTQHMMSPAL